MNKVFVVVYSSENHYIMTLYNSFYQNPVSPYVSDLASNRKRVSYKLSQASGGGAAGGGETPWRATREGEYEGWVGDDATITTTYYEPTPLLVAVCDIPSLVPWYRTTG